MTPRPSVPLRTLTIEALAQLGAPRLADILLGVAETRPDLKRRLRMEVAAGPGPEYLVPQIDRRLSAFETSRGQITWRQKPAVLRDLEALRELISARLGELDRGAALERAWRFLETAAPVRRRLRGRDEALDTIYAKAAADLGGLLATQDPHLAAHALIDAAAAHPHAWAEWMPQALEPLSQATARLALQLASGRSDRASGWLTVLRHLADAADDADAFGATFSADALATPSVATEVALRYLKSGAVERAGEALRRGVPKARRWAGRLAAPDFEWESAWIDYLERSGDLRGAQETRWGSFERTLNVERIRAFTRRLADFEDVEAENRAFAYAAEYPDFQSGLRFLMEWPALPEASRMIEARKNDLEVEPVDAELWAAKLRRRHPRAAHLLLRRAAATAFRRREFKMCDRLTQEAESINV